MEVVVSEKHPVNFYLKLTLKASALLFICFICIYIFIDSYNAYRHVEGKYYLLILIAVSAAGFTYYYVLEYIKKVPRIVLTPKEILFNDYPYLVADIASIEITGKSPFIFSHIECATVNFRDNTTRHIFDDMYSNGPGLKSALDLLINDRKYVKRYNNRMEPSDISNEIFDFYKGSFFINLRTVGLIPCTVMMLFGLFSDVHLPGKLILFILTAWGLFLLHSQFYYFGISKNYFIIKNYLAFWKNETYHIDNIELISFESPGNRAPDLLKIILKNYKSKNFYASSLWNKDWRALQEALNSKDIKVRIY